MHIGNMHKKFGKDHVWFRRYPRGQTDRQAHRQTLITTLRNHSRGRSKKWPTLAA